MPFFERHVLQSITYQHGIPNKIMLFYRPKGTVVHYSWAAATDITFTGIEEIAWFGPFPWAYHWILRLKKIIIKDYHHGSLFHNFILTTLNKNRISHNINISWSQACKLAPDMEHLSGKFEGFDWRILSLTGHVDWALPLWREIKKYIFT